MEKNRIFGIIMAVLVPSVFLSSCASTSNLQALEVSGQKVFVTTTKRVNVLSPVYMKETVDSVQLLEGKYGDSSFTAICYVQADDKGMFISLLNDFGTSIGDMSFDGKNVSFESAVIDRKIPAEYIVADFQNVFYDAGILSQNYRMSKLDFFVEHDGAKETRRICSGKTLVEKITREGGTVVVENSLRGYSYKLTDGSYEEE